MNESKEMTESRHNKHRPKIVAVVPARLGGKRMPRKVLAPLNGRPVLWHAWNHARGCELVDEVYVVTDSEEIRSVVQSWGGDVLMTSSKCRSGTERIATVLEQIGGDFIVNVQADEPLVTSGLIEQLIRDWLVERPPIVTPVYRITQQNELSDANVVKVVRAEDGRAIYFSRHAVPFLRDVAFDDWLETNDYWGHIGVYGYRRDVLEDYLDLPVSHAEKSESLEQLRFLGAGYPIRTLEVSCPAIGINCPEDLERARQIMHSTEAL